MVDTRSMTILPRWLVGVLLVISITACAGNISETTTTALPDTIPPAATPTETDPVVRPEGWSEDTHSKDVDPNYDVVFAQDRVHQITITIDPQDWEAMQANMVALYGSGEEDTGFAGRGIPPEGGHPQPGEGGAVDEALPPEGRDRPNPPQEDALGGRPGGRGLGGDMTPENPMWVPATVTFEGNTWTNVGVRYKGSSSLISGWRGGSQKLPLKLDFDEFEEDHPEIDDQRFYGFKQLSLANSFHDASFLRDVTTANILAEAGLPAAATAFCTIILDYGDGPVTLGLYVMIEVIDDTAIERYFGSDDGNIYEAEGSAASFAAATYNQIQQSFQKENNTDQGDWGDIEALFDALHSDLRGTDPAAWRTNLESVLDVDGFLEWLAISAVIQHWDTYGAMSHNYYLYHDPATDRLAWISWDHNETMSSEGGGGPRGGPGKSVSLDKADVGDNWPLIRYLLDDPVYYEMYVGYLAETVAGPFQPDRMAETYYTLAELIAPYAIADVGETAFDSAVAQLIEYAYQRADAVKVFLASN